VYGYLLVRFEEGTVRYHRSGCEVATMAATVVGRLMVKVPWKVAVGSRVGKHCRYIQGGTARRHSVAGAGVGGGGDGAEQFSSSSPATSGGLLL
jgi:hypothetical protein